MYTYSVKWLFWEFAVEFTQCQTLNDRIIIKLMRFTLEQSVLNSEKLCKFNPITVLFSLTVAIESLYIGSPHSLILFDYSHW